VLISPPVADFHADDVTPYTGQVVQFTDDSSNPVSWSWTFQGGSPPTSTEQNPTVIYNSVGSYDVTLTVTNSSGSDTETKVDYITVSIEPPVADFVADNTAPDIGETVIFTDLSSNNPTSWVWTFNPNDITYVDGTNQTTQNPHVQFNSNGSYDVTLLAINDGGQDLETKENYINVGDVLSVTVDAEPDVVCFGDSSQLSCYPLGGTGDYTFSWTSDPTGFTSDEQNPVVQPDVTTTYIVEVSDGNETVSDDVMVTVNPLPEITLDWPESLCNQNEPPVQLVSYPSGGIYIGDYVSSTGIFYPESALIGWNSIIYEYEDENGCTNSEQDSIYVDECVGIVDINDEQVNIYPNPNKGEFIIQFSSENYTMVYIYNVSGMVVYKKEIKGVNELKVDLKNIPKGMYFVKLTGLKNQTIRKVLFN